MEGDRDEGREEREEVMGDREMKGERRGRM